MSKPTEKKVNVKNEIPLKNLPPSYDELHLQMFFEHEKGGLEQPVEKVILNRQNHCAIIEFKKASCKYKLH